MHRLSSSSTFHGSEIGTSESDVRHSDTSGSSYETAASDYSDCTKPTKSPFFRDDTCCGSTEHDLNEKDAKYQTALHPENPRSSVGTYASTIGLNDENAEEDESMYGRAVLERPQETYASEAVPASPADFAELFPSQRKISIKHDDSTSDGNMNLRLDTLVQTYDGTTQPVTLFHLRLHDLKKREFSLRRYSRDSGREVCHSVRKYQIPAAERRPSFQRSISNVLASMMSKTDAKTVNASQLQRSDSGYESIASRRSLEVEPSPAPAANPGLRNAQIPTNTTKLEFSNYAQVDVKRRGTKSSKRYEFEYWGTKYMWKRVSDKYDTLGEMSYFLYKANHDHILARIVPRPLAAAQACEERSKGGWIPPSTMWIDYEQILQSQSEIAE